MVVFSMSIASIVIGGTREKISLGEDNGLCSPSIGSVVMVGNGRNLALVGIWFLFGVDCADCDRWTTGRFSTISSLPSFCAGRSSWVASWVASYIPIPAHAVVRRNRQLTGKYSALNRTAVFFGASRPRLILLY